MASQQAEAALRRTLDEDLSATAQILANQIDPLLHASLVEASDEDSDAYREIVRILRAALQSDMPFTYAYTMRLTTDGLRFVVDAAPPGDSDGDGVEDHAYLGELYPDADPGMWDALRSARATVSPQPHSDKWGTFISGFAPIIAPDGRIDGLVGLDYRADDYLERIRRMRHNGWVTATVGAMMSLGLGGLVWLMGKRQLGSVRAIQQVMAALANSEEQLRSFITHAPAAVAMFDTEMRYLAYSRRWIEDYGLDALGDLTGRSHYDIFPDISDRWKAVHSRCLAGAIESNKQDPFVRHSGRTQWLQWEVRPWHHRDGKIGGVLMFTNDITESKEAEIALHVAMADARRLASAIDAHTDAVLLTDQEGRITRINRAFETLTGWPKDHALGKTLEIMESDPSCVGAYQQMWETIRSGRPWVGRMRNQRRQCSDAIATAEAGLSGASSESGQFYWADVSITSLINDEGNIDGFVAVQRDVTDEVEREESLAEAAQTDRLTGIGNRSFVHNCIQRAIELRRRRPEHQFALMFLDLDRFKVVNDSLGHHVGDLLLQAVASRLREILRATDCVVIPGQSGNAARWGGDEFVVIVEAYQRLEDIAVIADRILRMLAEPYHLAGHTVQTSTSIGVVVGNESYQSADQMLRDADIAMYEAKARGKACWAMFDTSMQKAVERRLRIETELHTALKKQQFYLEYQPIVQLQTGALHGVEALVRWNHPTRGRISPDEFIPIAEENRAIFDLGRWVLEEACRQWVTWNRANPDHTPAFLSVNLSRAQIVDQDFVDNVLAIIQRTGIPPQRLVFEVTESTVMRDRVQTQEAFRVLRQMGVRLAIDDFGAGYSSLACLHQFPFDILKIDRSFISNFQQSEQLIVLTQAIVNLAHYLGLECVAEGIENPAQRQALMDMGCPLAQGYYFGKPVKPASILDGTWRNLQAREESDNRPAVFSFVTDPSRVPTNSWESHPR